MGLWFFEVTFSACFLLLWQLQAANLLDLLAGFLTESLGVICLFVSNCVHATDTAAISFDNNEATT